jgi:hypothetical protein
VVFRYVPGSYPRCGINNCRQRQMEEQCPLPSFTRQSCPYPVSLLLIDQWLPDLYGWLIVGVSGLNTANPSRVVEIRSTAEDILEAAKRDKATLKIYVSIESSMSLIRPNCNKVDSSSRRILPRSDA